MTCTFRQFSLLLLRNETIRKNIYHKRHKTYFLKYALSRWKTFKISRAIVRETLKMLSGTKIPSTSIAKRLEIEQGRFLKRE